MCVFTVTAGCPPSSLHREGVSGGGPLYDVVPAAPPNSPPEGAAADGHVTKPTTQTGGVGGGGVVMLTDRC